MATRYVMEQGVTYLIKEPKPDDSLKIFASLVKHGARGFCITRVHPKRIRKRFDLGETPILWITTSEVADEKCVHPSDLAKLNMAINDMLRNAENLAILLEGVEYLVTYNGFDSILRFVQVINDRIMVTNSRFIMTLDPATLDSSSLHILERDLTPIEDLSKLEVTFSEFPEAVAVTGDRWRPQLEERLKQWKERGLSVGALEKALEAGRDEAQKAFQEFEAFARRAAAVDDELRGMGLEGFRAEQDSIRARLRDSATIKEAEDALVELQVSAEKQKKDQSRRKGDEGRQREELRARLADWTSQGYLTLPLSTIVEGPLEEARREFERFDTAVRKLKDLKEELLLMDTTGFEAELESIRPRLMAPSRVSEVEDDVFRLKILIERRRKEERRKREEDDRYRTDLSGRLSQWRGEGFDTRRLAGWEGLPAAEARSRFEAFEKDVQAMRDIEGELGTLPQRGIEADIARVRGLLRDLESLPQARSELATLRARAEKGQDDRRREDFERKLQEWKVLGYNIDRLRELGKTDPDTLQKELVVFKIRVHRLKELEGELALLDTSGLGGEAAALMPLFKDVDKISEVESRLAELRLKIKGRAEEARGRREESGRKKRELVDRMSVWLSQGYSVSRLEALLDSEPDLARITAEFDRFEKDIVRLKELAGRLKVLDTAGFEREAGEVRAMLSDLERASEAEAALSALESAMQQQRGEARRQASEEDRRRKKALERINAWKEQGHDVSRLERALEEGLDSFKNELSGFNLRLEKLRGIREELALLDARGLEPELESLRAKLQDVENAEAAEEGLRALRARIDERTERERREKEAEKEERQSYIQKLLAWSSQGLVIEKLERAIDRPMEELRAEFGAFEKGLHRLEEIRKALVDLDLAGLEAEADRVRLGLNDPGLLPAVELDFAALNERAAERDRGRRERESAELRRAAVRERVAKLGASGIRTGRMDRFLDGDLETLENELDLYLEDVKRLRALRKRFDALARPASDERAARLEPLLDDPDSIQAIEAELEELELASARRTDAEKARRDELASKVDGWGKGGLNVQSLRDASKADLASYEKAVAEFERDLEDYRRGMERIIRFQKDYLAPGAPAAESAAGVEEPAAGMDGRGDLRAAGLAVAEEVRRIRELEPRRRPAEERIRMEQRLRTKHRALQRDVNARLAERQALRRRRRVLAGAAAAAITVAVAAAVMLAVILPQMAPGGIAIDGKFEDWDAVDKRSFMEDPSVPDNIDIRQTGLVRQGGDVFLFVRTYGTILKGSQNSTTKTFRGDFLRVYFDTDRMLSTGKQVGGIGADYMVDFYGWNNIVQEIDYLRYDSQNPQAPWVLLKVPSSEDARAVMSRLEARIEPGHFNLDSLPTDLLVIEMEDSEGNTDAVG
jgi:hypothetical protein